MGEIKRIEVAVGIIFNQAGEVLIGQRTVQDQYLNKWEFPGGKLEAGESAKAALRRELFEELTIEVEDCEHLMVVEHDYPDRQVRLYVQKVTHFSGEPTGAEQQALRWIDPKDLANVDFLAGNQVIIDRLL